MIGTKEMICTTAAFALLAWGSLSCASQVPAMEKDACVTPENMLPEQGWIDEHTYQLSRCGVPPKDTPSDKRKAEARKAALLNCQYYILNNLIEKYTKKWNELYGNTNILYTSGIPQWRKELNSAIKNGTVIHEKCGDTGCSVTYRVSKNGLKRSIDELPDTLTDMKK